MTARIYFLIFFRMRIYGKKNLPKGAALLAANHASFLDPPLIGSSLWPHVPFFLARDTLFQWNVLAWILRQCRSLPIKRGQGNAALFRQVMKLTSEGKQVMLFPEGTRTEDGKLMHALPGIGLLVQKANCQVVPMYIYGTFDAWGPAVKRPKPWGKFALVVGTPVDFSKIEGERKEKQRQIGHTIMAAIGELEKWYLDGAKGEVP